MRSLALFLLTGACTSDTPDTPSNDTDGQADDTDTTTAPSAGCGGDEAVAAFVTEDEVTLAADYWPSSEADAPLVILVHMTPVAWDRSSWPKRFRAALHDAGYAVLTLDRRGAGDSGGVPQDAFEGDGGRLDLEAAVRWVAAPEQPCPIDRSKIAFIGASNGTTSVLDYGVAHADDLPDPAAAIFLSPGTYTENQHNLEDDWTLTVPFLWIYPRDEDWAPNFAADHSPPDWLTLFERGQLHGTLMFDGDTLETQVTADITAHLADAL